MTDDELEEFKRRNPELMRVLRALLAMHPNPLTHRKPMTPFGKRFSHLRWTHMPAGER